MCTVVTSNNKMFAGNAAFLMVLVAVEHLVTFLKAFYNKSMENEDEFLRKEKENDMILKAHIDTQNRLASDRVLDGSYMKE